MSRPAKVAIDLQALQVEGYADRGIGRYAAALATAFARQGRLAAALLAPELPPPIQLPPELVSEGLVRWDGVSAARELLAAGPCVHHVPAPFLHTGATDPSVLVPAPHWAAAGCSRMVTVHDLIPLQAPHHYLSAPGALDRYRTRGAWVAASDVVLADSEYTRREAIERLGCDPDQVVNTGVGVSPYFCGPDGTDEQLFRARIPRFVDRRFLFCVVGADVRKNSERLIEALGLLTRGGSEVGLVAAGHLPGPWLDRLRDAAGAAGVADRVEFTGAISTELLRACYRRAALTVMPSLAEGFGLPVLESAACGTAAAASATTALPEVAASPRALFDPADAHSIAGCLGRLLEDPDCRREVTEAQAAVAKGLSWDAVAARALDAIDGFARSGRPLPAGAPPARIQALLVGPVAPDGGGIGVYNERLLLGSGATFDWTVAVDRPLGQPLDPVVGAAHPAAIGLDVRPASFDAVVYTFGNSSGHLERVELALRHPGWLWLHEVRLPALAVTALDHLGEADFATAMRRLLARAYPGRAPTATARRAGRSIVDLGEAGVGLAGLLAERCRGVLVNSEVARRLLLLDLPPHAAPPPIHVVPPMCPPVGADVEPHAGGEAGLVAFGIVSMAKRPDLLVDAAALLGCPLTFVGPSPPILEQVITDRATIRGNRAAVRVVGAVDDGEWRQWLRDATVAVQLRESTTGETSAAVLDALAAGAPVATSVASVNEYPEGTCALLGTISAEALAADLGLLLESPEHRRSLSAAGLEFARAHQAVDLAAALARIVSGDPTDRR